MPRVSQEDVAGICQLQAGDDLTPFIGTATALIDEVLAADYDEDYLTVIEKWLAAHFYLILRPQYKDSQAGQSRMTIESRVDLGLNVTRHGQQVLMLEWKGKLRALSDGRTMTARIRHIAPDNWRL